MKGGKYLRQNPNNNNMRRHGTPTDERKRWKIAEKTQIKTWGTNNANQLKET